MRPLRAEEPLVPRPLRRSAASRHLTGGIARWLRRHRALLSGAAAAVFMVVAAAVAGFVVEHGPAIADALRAHVNDRLLPESAELGLSVGEVVVVGRGHLDVASILDAVRAKPGSPILAFDTALAETRLRALPWVERASVTRRLPQVIVVRITERRPVALWQHQGKLALIDRAGTPIVPAELVRFAHLPIIVGATAARHAGVVLDMLGTEPALYARVVAAVRVADRRWDVRLDNGVVVRLPADRLLTAWRYLAEIERDDHILQRDIAVVDLRLPDRLTVRLTPAAAIRMRDPGQSA